jgi:xanthine dehydrogenase accessory factor
MDIVLPALQKALDGGTACVLVTVIWSEGSVPRGAGANMLVTASGECVGTVGGGTLEKTAELEAKELIAQRRGDMRRYEMSSGDITGADMICGGRVCLHFRYISPEDAAFCQVIRNAAEMQKRNADSWVCFPILPDGSGEWTLHTSPVEAPVHLRPVAITQEDERGTEYYSQPLAQSGIVYVFGAGHVAHALVPVLTTVGFRVRVLDDREGLLTQERFPTAEELKVVDYQDSILQLDISTRDYIVVMTEGHRGDFALACQALNTPARYIGILGSRKKAALAREALSERGYTPEQIARMRCPVGIEIGGGTPEEIAISITAQMIAERSGQLS